MIIDGKDIANTIYKETAESVSSLSRAPRMTAITCAPNFETQKYLNLKKQKAAEVGISLNIVELSEDVTTEEVVACIQAVAKDADGIVTQLPFPPHVDREVMLKAIPPDKDPDGFNYELSELCLPPVVGAIDEIAKKYNFSWEDKKVAVVGYGTLVGKPAAHYAKSKGAQVTVITENTENPNAYIQEADIIISGTGRSHSITSDMVKEDVCIFDAGTSEDNGELAGDVHPDVVQKASLFTPVPGGIGPITVAYLLRNLVTLVRQ